MTLIQSIFLTNNEEKMLSVQKDFDFNQMALIDKNLLPFNLQDVVLISDHLGDSVLNIESFFSGIY